MDEVHIYDDIAVVNDSVIETDHLTPEGGEVATYEAAMTTQTGVEWPGRFSFPVASQGRVVRHAFRAFYDEDGVRRIQHESKEFTGPTRWGIRCTERAEGDLDSLWVEYMIWRALT